MSNEMTNRKVGRPLKFQSVEELQVEIDKYFNLKLEEIPWNVTLQ